MKTKLTLTIEKSILERAISYAIKTGSSLSEIIEKYLESLIEDNSTHKLSPKLKKIVGAVKLPANFNEKENLRSEIQKKQLVQLIFFLYLINKI